MRGWWWLWSRCPGIGVARMRSLEAAAAEHGVELADLWGWSSSRLGQALSWPQSVLDQIDRYRLARGTSPDLKVPANALLPGDAAWPPSLNQLNQPPLGLFFEGEPALIEALAQQRAVAVVGTRASSSHGLRMAKDLGRALALAGWPVLSGLADGIDGAVHHGCLEAGGAPVAVLGTPLTRVYPRHHEALQRRIARSGLLLSEHGPGTPVQRRHFASRNRLLVAFACAVVVVECPERSGALITARLAHELQRPVWVVPGDAGRLSTRGSNALLQDRAAPLLSPAALIRHLGAGPLPQPSSGRSEAQHHQAVLNALGEGLSLDELSQQMGRPVGALARELLELELDGQVLCESGLHWRPVRR